MKKLLTLILLLIVIAGCKNSGINPDTDELTGTAWSRYYFGFPDGRQMYKVLRFRENKYVKIDYTFDKKETYMPVGLLAYTKEGDKFWVADQVATTSGQVFGDSLVLNGETFLKE